MNLFVTRRAMMAAAFFVAACSCSMVLHAQSGVQTYSDTKYLVVQREFTKPGRDGSAHQATEAALMHAAAAGKAPFHYVALTSLSGRNRVLFFEGYPTLEAVEAEHKQIGGALQTSLDRAMMAHGDLLSGQEASVWAIDPELSQNTDAPRARSRYMVVRKYVVKPGHTEEWERIVKMVRDGYEKAGTGAHWSTYRLLFGESTGPTYLILTSMKSMSEMDGMMAGDSKFVEAMGQDGLKKLDELEASCVESSEENIFAIDPKMSIPTDEMLKAEPEFWRPKAVAAGTGRKAGAASGQ